MAISDIPGYVQGFRFSDDSTFYDSTTKVFHDLAGYGAFNALTITAGTPAFVDVSGQRGLTLDNTVQGRLLPATPWEGALIVVMKPNMSANGTIYACINGVAVSAASNGQLRITRASATDYRHNITTTNSGINPINQYNTGDMGGIKVGAFSISQVTRKGYATKDGVTVSETAAAAANNAWVPISGKLTSRTDGQWTRFGNLSGVLEDVAPTTNTLTIFELHFFKGNPLVDALPQIAVEIAALKAQYGAS